MYNTNNLESCNIFLEEIYMGDLYEFLEKNGFIKKIETEIEEELIKNFSIKEKIIYNNILIKYENLTYKFKYAHHYGLSYITSELKPKIRYEEYKIRLELSFEGSIIGLELKYSNNNYDLYILDIDGLYKKEEELLKKDHLDSFLSSLKGVKFDEKTVLTEEEFKLLDKIHDINLTPKYINKSIY